MPRKRPSWDQARRQGPPPPLWLADEPPVIVEYSCGRRSQIVARCVHRGADVDAPADPADWSEHFVAPGRDRRGPLGG